MQGENSENVAEENDANQKESPLLEGTARNTHVRDDVPKKRKKYENQTSPIKLTAEDTQDKERKPGAEHPPQTHMLRNIGSRQPNNDRAHA